MSWFNNLTIGLKTMVIFCGCAVLSTVFLPVSLYAQLTETSPTQLNDSSPIVQDTKELDSILYSKASKRAIDLQASTSLPIADSIKQALQHDDFVSVNNKLEQIRVLLVLIERNTRK